MSADEIGAPPVHMPSGPPASGQAVAAMFDIGGRGRSQTGQLAGAAAAGLSNLGSALSEYGNRKEQAEYQHKAQTLGRPRLAPEEVRELVARHAEDTVARSMIAFATGGAVYNLRLHPYFLPDPVPPSQQPLTQGQIAGRRIMGAAIGFFALGAIGGNLSGDPAVGITCGVIGLFVGFFVGNKA